MFYIMCKQHFTPSSCFLKKTKTNTTTNNNVFSSSPSKLHQSDIKEYLSSYNHSGL